MIVLAPDDFIGFFSESYKENNEISCASKKVMLDDSGNACGIFYGDQSNLSVNNGGPRKDSNCLVTWSSKNKTLSLLRTYPGLKSLYYLSHNNVLYFSNNLQYLLEYTSHVSRTFNIECLVDLALFGRILPPATLFADIYHLPLSTKQTWEMNRSNLKVNSQEIEIEKSHIDSLLQLVLSPDNTECQFNPHCGSTEHEEILKITEPLSNPSNIDLYYNLPPLINTIFEPVTNTGSIILSILMNQRVGNIISWDLSSDLSTNKACFNERWEWLKKITRKEWQEPFEQYLYTKRLPSLLKRIEKLQVEYPQLSQDSLINICFVFPERIRNTDLLAKKHNIKATWSNTASNITIHRDELPKEPTLHFSNIAPEVGNIFAQTFHPYFSKKYVGDHKLVDIFKLKPLETRKAVNDPSIYFRKNFEEILCGFLSVEYLWRNYQ